MLINQLFHPGTLNTWADINCSESVWKSLEQNVEVWGQIADNERFSAILIFFETRMRVQASGFGGLAVVSSNRQV